MPRVEVKEDEEPIIEITGEYTALPDNSNVGMSGVIYPAEGMTHNGVKITRDPETGVLGFGNGQKGGIYLGLVYPTNGVKIEVGSFADDGYDGMRGQYTQKGDYIYWDSEWDLIHKVSMNKVQKIANPTEGMVADIEGNLTTGHYTDKNVFYAYLDGCWQPTQY